MVYAGTSYFGENARKKIPEEVKKRKLTRCVLMTDEGLIRCGAVEKIEEVLKKADIPYSVFSNIKPNPTIDNVLEGWKVFEEKKSDFLLAVGGGSVIDTAKAVAVIANNPKNRDVVSLEGMDRAEYPPVPLIALPTTAGTGSETTMDFVITNLEEKRKMACMDSRVVPVAAILDTDIMAKLPLKMTAATAMDALTHAIESYLTPHAFAFSEMLSLKAIELILANFEKVLENPTNLEIRKQLAIAQFLAGMSFTNVGLGIVHSMAHPLSAFYDIPHGVANAMILPEILEFNAQECPEKIKKLADVFGIPYTDRQETGKNCADRIRSMNRKAGLPQTLKEVHVRTEDMEALAQSALEDVSTLDNPRKVNVQILRELYEKIYE